MVSIPTTLILGAGASAEFGYPLGRQLIDQLASQKKQKISVGRFSVEESQTFLDRLSMSGFYSIDEFLTRNPDLAEIGKLWIARELKSCEKLDRLYPPHRSGWYQYLFNRLLVDGEPSFDQNRLSIVTFNYDRSLEAYLFHTLRARFQMSSDEAVEILSHIPIVHVHGILGRFPEIPYDNENLEDLDNIAKEIKIIGEIQDVDDDFCSEEFRLANKLITASDKLYFMGFGFHADNLRRMRLGDTGVDKKKTWSTSTNWPPMLDGDVKTRLKALGCSLQTTAAVGCADWFDFTEPLS